MAKELVLNRMLDFKRFVITNKRLPKVWEIKFLDKEDMRLWFDTILKLPNFQSFVTEINTILQANGKKILTDLEKEQEFLNYILKYNKIPQNNEAYFSDESEMLSWYRFYRIKHPQYEEQVHQNLYEYQEFDINLIWPRIKDEFLSIIKKFKRIPNHGEAKTTEGIDIRVIYDKLLLFDPEFCEKLLLYLSSSNKNSLIIDERISELTKEVAKLGYIPSFQEARFSDDTDMFTWYSRYKDKLPNLEMNLNKEISSKKEIKPLNIYYIPHLNTSKGGRYFTVYVNTGERLNIADFNCYEEAAYHDLSFSKRGEVFIKDDEVIPYEEFRKGI